MAEEMEKRQKPSLCFVIDSGIRISQYFLLLNFSYYSHFQAS